MKEELIKLLDEISDDANYYREMVADGDALWGFFDLLERKVRQARELHDEYAESEGLE